MRGMGALAERWWTASLVPLVVADLRRRYAGSVLGGLWAWLGPLAEVAAYALLFGWMLGPAAGGGARLAVQIASGLMPWMALREALEGSAAVLQEHRWIRRSRVPPQLLVARLVLVTSPRALVGLLVVALAVAASGAWPPLGNWLWPVAALVLQLMATYGLGLGLSPLATLYPDMVPDADKAKGKSDAAARKGEEAKGRVAAPPAPEPEPEPADEDIAFEAAPPPASPAQPPRDPAEAEQRFFNRYGEIVGGDSWAAVQGYLRSRAPKPTTVEGWIAAAEAVRDRSRQDSSPAMAA